MMDRVRKSFCIFRGGIPEDKDFTEVGIDPGSRDNPALREMIELSKNAFEVLNKEAPENVAFLVVVIDLRQDDPSKIIAVDRFSGTVQEKPNLYLQLASLAASQLKRIQAAINPKKSGPSS